MKLAIVQMESVMGEVSRNIDAALRLLDEAPASGAPGTSPSPPSLYVGSRSPRFTLRRRPGHRRDRHTPSIVSFGSYTASSGTGPLLARPP